MCARAGRGGVRGASPRAAREEPKRLGAQGARSQPQANISPMPARAHMLVNLKTPCKEKTQDPRPRLPAEQGRKQAAGMAWRRRSGSQSDCRKAGHGHNPNGSVTGPGGSQGCEGRGPGSLGPPALPAAQPRTPVLDPNHPGLRHGFLPTTPWGGARSLTQGAPSRQPHPTSLALPPGLGGWEAGEGLGT